jgi:hypothetical protein
MIVPLFYRTNEAFSNLTEVSDLNKLPGTSLTIESTSL